MEYVLPGFVQRRALRYVLGRLDILDTEALNLDNLDVRLGRRSVIELKNVSIKKSKLQEYSNHFPGLLVHIDIATISLLRITIPADLYQNGISLDGHGVRIKASISPRSGLDAHNREKSEQFDQELYDQVGRGNKDLPPPTGDEPLQSFGSSGGDDASRHSARGPSNAASLSGVLDPVDLAHSFLETQSPGDLQQMQFESQQESSDQTSDPATVTKPINEMQQPLALLPTFLSSFLQSTLDRISIHLHDLRADIAIYLSGSHDCPIQSLPHLAADTSIELTLFMQSLIIGPEQNPKGETKNPSNRDSSFVARPNLAVSVLNFDLAILTNDEKVSSASSKTAGSSLQPDQDFPNEGFSSQSFPTQDAQAFESAAKVVSPGDDSRNWLQNTSKSHFQDLDSHAGLQASDSGLDPMIQDSRGIPDSSERSESSTNIGSPSSAYLSLCEEAEIGQSQKASKSMPGGWQSTFAGFPNSFMHASKEKIEGSGTETVQESDLENNRDRTENDRLWRDGARSSLFRGERVSAAGHLKMKRIGHFDRFIASFWRPKTDAGGMSVKSASNDRFKHLSEPMKKPDQAQLRTSSFHLHGLAFYCDIPTIELGLILKDSILGHLHTTSPEKDKISSDYDFQINIDIFSIHLAPSLRLYDTPPSADQSKTPITRFDQLDQKEEDGLIFRLSALHGAFRQQSCYGSNISCTVRDIKLMNSYKDILTWKVDTGDSAASTDKAEIAVHVVYKSNANIVITEISSSRICALLDISQIERFSRSLAGLVEVMSLSVHPYLESRKQKTRAKENQPGRSVRFADFPKHDMPGHGHPKLCLRITALECRINFLTSQLCIETLPINIVKKSVGLSVASDDICIRGYSAGQRQNSRQNPENVKARISMVRIDYDYNPSEHDLERLVQAIEPIVGASLPSKVPVHVGLLLRQRRRGASIRISVDQFDFESPQQSSLDLALGMISDLQQLSTIAKYLPASDRPGVLILVHVKSIEIRLWVDAALQYINCTIGHTESTYVTCPPLSGGSLDQIKIIRNENELLMDSNTSSPSAKTPPFRFCFAGDDLDPAICFEIHDMDICYNLKIADAAAASWKLRSTGRQLSDNSGVESPDSSAVASPNDSRSASQHASSCLGTKSTQFTALLNNVVLHLEAGFDCDVDSSIYFEGASVRVSLSPSSTRDIDMSLQKAVMELHERNKLAAKSSVPSGSCNSFVIRQDSIRIGTLTSTKARLSMQPDLQVGPSLGLEVSKGLFIAETCADSTQSLIKLLTSCAPTRVRDSHAAFRTQIVPIETLLDSIIEEAYVPQRGKSNEACSSPKFRDLNEDTRVDQRSSTFGSTAVSSQKLSADSSPADSVMPEALTNSDMVIVESAARTCVAGHGQTSNDPEFLEDYFREDVQGKALHSLEGDSKEASLVSSPVVKVQVQDFHVIWNLFDGYDLQTTRDKISRAVHDLENKAKDRSARVHAKEDLKTSDDKDDIVADCLFNSIYIGIDPASDNLDLTQEINKGLDQFALEPELGRRYTSHKASSPKIGAKQQRQPLRLARGKYHKMTFELQGIGLDFCVYGDSRSEVQSVARFGVQEFEIFDHVPTSTWKKFATYLHEAGRREDKASMISVEVKIVKPVAELTATEMEIQVSMLPVRLHVDQDALDFMTRFFDFRAQSAEPPASTTNMFIQRLEVFPVQVKLDFKPKRVDYHGLRSGRTAEFMNFFILDRAEMVLRHVILYGVPSLERAGKMLNDIWTPDVKQNQLPNVLAGLGPFRSVVTASEGLRNLIVIPIEEYKGNGKVARSVQRGMMAFAKTSATEFLKLGTKLALGSQGILQSAEDMLNPRTAKESADKLADDWEEMDNNSTGSMKHISRYANSPVGITQGLRQAYTSLSHDLISVKDAIIALPGELLESDNVGEVAGTLIRTGPTLVLRPALGISKAVGQTFMGATNAIDPAHRLQNDDKYKKG